MKKYIYISTLAFIISISINANAQFIENALHLSQSNTVISPRTGALGYSYFGISDDGAAMIYNPAGLTLLSDYEMGVGFNFTNSHVKTNFLGNTKEQTSNDAYFTNVQFVFPYISRSYNYAFALGYFLENDYDATYKYNGFNTQNTFTAEQASIHAPWTYATYLADANYNTNIKNNMQQAATIMESGGLHNIVFSFAMDLMPSVALGGSLIAKTGSYDFRRSYNESDPNNMHNKYEIDDIDYVSAKEALTQDIYGVTGIIGVQARLENYFRFGMSIEFPSYLYINEYSSTYYTVQYDPDPKTNIAPKYDYYGGCYNPEYCEYESEYSIYTPFIFSFGASANIFGATISAAVSYQNAADIAQNYEWDDDPYYWENYDYINEEIREKLTGQFTLGLGVEYKISNVPLYLRAGYTNVTSPYIDSDMASSRQSFAGGLSWVFMKKFSIDMAFVYNTYEKTNINYGTADNPSLYSTYKANYTPVNYSFGFRYRF